MKSCGFKSLLVLLLSVSPIAGQTQSPASRNQPPASQVKASATVPASGMDTSNWKIYRNEKHGFEVKYPETWGVSAGRGIGPELIYLNKPLRAGEPNASLALAIQTNQNPRKRSIEEWFAEQLQLLKATPGASGRVIIGGQPAMFMENTNSFGKQRDTFTLLHETDVLSLSYSPQARFDPTFAAIAASFRIVK